MIRNFYILTLFIFLNKNLMNSVLKGKNLLKIEKLEEIKNGKSNASRSFLNANIIKGREALKDENGKNALMVFIEEFCKNLSQTDESSLANILAESAKKYKLAEVDSNGNNVLHYLVKENLALTLKKLLDNKNHSFIKEKILELRFTSNKEGLSPIAMCIDKNLLQIADALQINTIEAINKTIDSEENTSLMRALKTYPSANSEIFKLFIKDEYLKNLNLEKENKQNENILLIAIKTNKEFAKQFIDLYAANGKSFVDKINKNGENALIISIKENKKDISEYLLNLGADPLKLTTQGESPFSITIELGNQEICEKILKRYPNYINEKINGREDTPLIYAIENEKENLIEYFLYHDGIDFSLSNSEEEDALLKAIKKKRSDLVERLIKANINLDYELKGTYLIVWAAHLGLEEAVEILLAADAPKEQDKERMSKKAALSLGNIILSNVVSDKIKDIFLGFIPKSKEQEELKEPHVELAYKKIKEVALKGEWILRRQKYSPSTLKAYEEVINFFTERLQRIKEEADLEIKKEKEEAQGYILENKQKLFEILEKKEGEELDSLAKVHKKVNDLINRGLNGSQGLRTHLFKIKKEFFYEEFTRAKADADKEKFKNEINELRKRYSNFLKEKIKLEIALKHINSEIRKLKNPLTSY